MASAAYFTLAVCGEVYAPSALTIWTRNSIYETLVFPTAMVGHLHLHLPPSLACPALCAGSCSLF